MLSLNKSGKAADITLEDLQKNIQFKANDKSLENCREELAEMFQTSFQTQNKPAEFFSQAFADISSQQEGQTEKHLR